MFYKFKKNYFRIISCLFTYIGFDFIAGDEVDKRVDNIYEYVKDSNVLHIILREETMANRYVYLNPSASSF